MDNVNEVAFFSALAVTVPVGFALVPIGPVVLGHSLVALIISALMVLISVILLVHPNGRASGWRRAGPIILIGGAVIGLGSTEITMALLLALMVIDILLGSFTGAERLVNLRTWSTPD